MCWRMGCMKYSCMRCYVCDGSYVGEKAHRARTVAAPPHNTSCCRMRSVCTARHCRQVQLCDGVSCCSCALCVLHGTAATPPPNIVYCTRTVWLCRRKCSCVIVLVLRGCREALRGSSIKSRAARPSVHVSCPPFASDSSFRQQDLLSPVVRRAGCNITC